MQPGKQLLGIALQHGNRLTHQLRILLLRDLAGARRTAQLHMSIQTRARLADIARQHALARAQPEHTPHRVNCLKCRAAAAVRTEIPVRILSDLSHDGKFRKRPAGRDLDERIALVILEQNIVMRLVFFNHGVLKHQSLELALAHNDVEMVDMRDHLPRFFGVALLILKILRYAVFERLCLADVNDLVPGVFHDINPRLTRQRKHLLFQLAFLHTPSKAETGAASRGGTAPVLFLKITSLLIALNQRSWNR